MLEIAIIAIATSPEPSHPNISAKNECVYPGLDCRVAFLRSITSDWVGSHFALSNLL